jgi:hypothetical protein
VTFRDCAERYVAAHEKSWKSHTYRTQWRSTLRDYVYPILGDRPVSAVDTSLVIQIIEPLWQTKAKTAVDVRGRIESVLDWAKAREFRSGENPARWRGHLDHLLPASVRVRRVKHHSALPYSELPGFLARLREPPRLGRSNLPS